MVRAFRGCHAVPHASHHTRTFSPTEPMEPTEHWPSLLLCPTLPPHDGDDVNDNDNDGDRTNDESDRDEGSKDTAVAVVAPPRASILSRTGDSLSSVHHYQHAAYEPSWFFPVFPGPSRQCSTFACLSRHASVFCHTGRWMRSPKGGLMQPCVLLSRAVAVSPSPSMSAEYCLAKARGLQHRRLMSPSCWFAVRPADVIYPPFGREE